MKNTVFRFYSEDPWSLHRVVYQTIGPALVRFDGRKAGQLPVYKMTIVLDDPGAATEFETWLTRNSCETRLIEMGFKSQSETRYRLHRSTFLGRTRRRVSSLFKQTDRRTTS